MFDDFISARRASASFTSARRSSPGRADDGGFLPPSPEEAAPYFTEPEKIMLECALATAIAGSSAAFTAFAFTGDWGPLLASSGAGLGSGICFLGVMASVGCFKKLIAYQAAVMAEVRNLQGYCYYWKLRAEELAWNSAAAEAAGTVLDRGVVPAANPKVIYPEWRR